MTMKFNSLPTFDLFTKKKIVSLDNVGDRTELVNKMDPGAVALIGLEPWEW